MPENVFGDVQCVHPALQHPEGTSYIRTWYLCTRLIDQLCRNDMHIYALRKVLYLLPLVYHTLIPFNKPLLYSLSRDYYE